MDVRFDRVRIAEVLLCSQESTRAPELSGRRLGTHYAHVKLMVMYMWE